VTRRIGRLTLTGSLLACFGFAVLLVCSIPITSAEVVIDISFTVPPGSKYGPNDAGTGYHTRILGKSILEGEVLVEGGGIYVTAGFFNTQHVDNVYVDRQYNFVIDPADDLYVFVFDNTNGKAESLVRFTLKEVWTRPMAIGSPPLFILGLIWFVLLMIGLAALVIAHLRSRGPFTSWSGYMGVDKQLYDHYAKKVADRTLQVLGLAEFRFHHDFDLTLINSEPPLSSYIIEGG